jgi:Tol biopolymer transport system component
MYFTAFLPQGRGNIDIYFTDLSADYPEVFNVGAPINSEFDELQPSLAGDKSFLLFTSNRPGGYGKYDVYVSFLNDSIWSEPKNLGPKINTAHDEFSAWVTPDGRFVLFDRVIGREQDIYWISADILDEVSDNDQ